MGALKNSVKRRTHKERPQPLGRHKYGLLEKKKDYKLRANDYHKKEDSLQVLRRKAEERNPDEFYFSMETARTQGGVHIKQSSASNKYTQEELQLMKTQDLKYINLKAQTEAKKIERLRARLHGVNPETSSTHTIFVDEEADLASFPTSQENERKEMSFNDNVDEQRNSSELELEDESQNSKLQRYTRGAYRELLERSERHRRLLAMAEEMALQKELMGKGTVRKIHVQSRDGAHSVYKWRIERKT